jgi:hypothetical protein
MVSATAARLLFFGGRYLSVLFLARLLGSDAAGFLLALVVVELLRVMFDYGLESSVLARLHQKGGTQGESFRQGKGKVRLLASVVGQMVATGAVVLLCYSNGTPASLPVIASLQFSCLMGFGYLQAHLQTGQSGGMAALMPPLALAFALQVFLLAMAQQGYAPVWLCTIFFEVMALAAAALVTKRLKNKVGEPKANRSAMTARLDIPACKAVLWHIAPIGNAALMGIAYSRLDALVVSWVAGGALLTQYLIYQRLASAPLMFFSTIASVSISSFSDSRRTVEPLSKRIGRFRQLAYAVAAVSGIALAGSTPLIASFFSLEFINRQLLGLQCLVLAVQISNGFHAALLIALGKSSHLWPIARNNALVAAVVLPLGAWKLDAVGVALALCLVEAFCAIQYVLFFRKGNLPIGGADA